MRDSSTLATSVLPSWAIVSLAEMAYFVYSSRGWLERLMAAGEAGEFKSSP